MQQLCMAEDVSCLKQEMKKVSGKLHTMTMQKRVPWTCFLALSNLLSVIVYPLGKNGATLGDKKVFVVKVRGLVTRYLASIWARIASFLTPPHPSHSPEKAMNVIVEKLQEAIYGPKCEYMT